MVTQARVLRERGGLDPLFGLPLEHLRALVDATFRQKVWLAPSPARDRLDTLLNFSALVRDIEALLNSLEAVEVVSVTQELVVSCRFDDGITTFG